jgi:hypothetical protein
MALPPKKVDASEEATYHKIRITLTSRNVKNLEKGMFEQLLCESFVVVLCVSCSLSYFAFGLSESWLSSVLYHSLAFVARCDKYLHPCLHDRMNVMERVRESVCTPSRAYMHVLLLLWLVKKQYTLHTVVVGLGCFSAVVLVLCRSSCACVCARVCACVRVCADCSVMV